MHVPLKSRNITPTINDVKYGYARNLFTAFIDLPLHRA